ncbi:hypothetical protein GTP45_01240 [Pseudoduganella sp. FT55W]|uniref:Uncharacterized protein n=1 Tax=Duganella rivi TaxID=2666083 RepID=A0A7X4GL23_9BURK|nr:hypothetical protein [Duganella rivi]MYM65457.1 hypothetical protein [Duganella rivi]
MFALNKPALQTAGQILNQQCAAAARAAAEMTVPRKGKPPVAPGVEDLVNAAITDLATASASYRSKQPPYVLNGEQREPVADKLASAVTHIFHLAEANGIDLGNAIALHLSDETTPF